MSGITVIACRRMDGWFWRDDRLVYQGFCSVCDGSRFLKLFDDGLYSARFVCLESELLYVVD